MSEIGDLTIGVTKAALSTIPAISPFITIWDSLKSGEYKRRADNFVQDIESRLDFMRDIELDRLKQNQLFATVLYISGQLAIKTNDEKRKLLANAVVNTATTTLSEDRVVILLNCFEKYTLQHLRMLRFLHNPSEYTTRDFSFTGGSPASIYEDYYRESERDLDRIIIRDLYQDGLSSVDSIHVNVSSAGVLQKKTTTLGDDFITFFGIEKDV